MITFVIVTYVWFRNIVIHIFESSDFKVIKISFTYNHFLQFWELAKPSENIPDILEISNSFLENPTTILKIPNLFRNKQSLGNGIFYKEGGKSNIEVFF